MTIYYPPTSDFIQKNLGAELLSGVTASATLNNVTAIQNLPGVMIIDRIDNNNTETPGNVEVISFAGTSGSTVTTLVRGLAGTTEQDHAINAVVEFGPDIVWAQGLIDTLLAEHNTDGTHKTGLALTSPALTTPKITTSINDANGNEVIKTPATTSAVNEITVTNSATGNAVTISATGGDDNISLNLVSKGTGTVQVNGTPVTSGILSTSQYAPQGFLINGKIVPSVASNNLTVALKGMDGNDPSSSNPVYCRIGDTVRTITSALSVTKNAGTNWCNAGSSELATKEIDYFVYLGYNATDGVVIGFSRIPYATRYDSFSTTSTAETYCAISTITTAAAGDYYEVIGRFAATLSAGAGYTWTVPTFTATNLIQRPIYETRVLSWVPTVAGISDAPSLSNLYYHVRNRDMYLSSLNISGTSNATTKTITAPFASLYQHYCVSPIAVRDNSSNQSVMGHIETSAGSATLSLWKTFYQGAWTSSGGFAAYIHWVKISI